MGRLIFRLLDSLVPAVSEAVEQGARSFPPCNSRARTPAAARPVMASRNPSSKPSSLAIRLRALLGTQQADH